MATIYVGSGGNDANNGLSWANRKLTLNGAEDIPVAAGDTVYVGPGTYRETLTCDVSGSAGSPIVYVGDYTGANTDGVGGVVRITGSDDDQTTARENCITGSSKNYRTFDGFCCDTTSGSTLNMVSCTNWTIQRCYAESPSGGGRSVSCTGATQASIVIDRCYFVHRSLSTGMIFEHSSAVSNAGHVIQNCVITGIGVVGHVVSGGVGGMTVRNCTFIYFNGEAVATRYRSLAAGQTVTVNNCILAFGSHGFAAQNLGEVIENYNSLYAIDTTRTNVNTGANSNTYPPLFDTRWFFEAVNGGSMVTPFDLASYSQLIDVAGTSPTTTDLRGTSVIGAQREWGALEFDPNLDIEAGAGGAVSISPFRGNIG